MKQQNYGAAYAVWHCFILGGDGIIGTHSLHWASPTETNTFHNFCHIHELKQLNQKILLQTCSTRLLMIMSNFMSNSCASRSSIRLKCFSLILLGKVQCELGVPIILFPPRRRVGAVKIRYVNVRHPLLTDPLPARSLG